MLLWYKAFVAVWCSILPIPLSSCRPTSYRLRCWLHRSGSSAVRSLFVLLHRGLSPSSLPVSSGLLYKPCSFPVEQLYLDRKQSISETGSQSSAVDSADKPCGSSKTRICLANKFELSEEAEHAESGHCAFTSSKKPRNA